MCCDMCARYDDCEKKNKLKDRCCSQCDDYEYCQKSNDHGHEEDDFKDDDRRFRDHY